MLSLFVACVARSATRPPMRSRMGQSDLDHEASCPVFIARPRESRIFRAVALPAREMLQMHIRCYMRHLPAADEIVIFDRSWHNRAGVERVMEF
jgi:hypothetical protein